MDCRETQALLTAFHDGELPADDRVRMEAHLRGCPACRARLADLARADQAAGVPDPGPAYWERFNARVMERVTREADGQGWPSAEAGRDATGSNASADGPGVAVLGPKHGWMRQQFRYLVPAAAAAALVVGIVRYGGMHPGVSTMAKDGQVSGQAGTPPDSKPRPAMDGLVPRQAGTPRILEPRPSSVAGEQGTAMTREERDRLADRSHPAGNEEAARDRAAAPPTLSGVPAVPPMTYRSVPAGSPPVTMEDGMPSGMLAERKKMAMGLATEAPPAESHGKMRSETGSPVLPSAPSSGDSPCEPARTLAARKRWRDAEAAQRVCLARDRSAPAQEKGLIFLAELLDRQARFAEADAVIAEVDRQFPQSWPLEHYRQQRPLVQKHPE